MVWKTLQLGYRFYFIKETFPAIERIRIQETIDELCNMTDPKKSALTCNNDKWCVVNVKGTDLLLAIVVHYDDDPVVNHRHCIELVNVINPQLL
jgi:hypothetical protein